MKAVDADVPDRDQKKLKRKTCEKERRARLNCIAHLLSQIQYKDVLPRDTFTFPKRKGEKHYKRPPREKQRYVPEVY